MAKKRPVRKKTTSKKGKKTKRFSLAKFSMILVIIIALGYIGLAIWEGQLFDDILQKDVHTDDKEVSNSNSEKKNSATNTEPSLSFDFDGFDLYFVRAFDFGWPAYSTDQMVIERPYYTLRYNERHEQAMWVSYKLSADSLRKPTFPRQDDFREDRRVRTGSASLEDYAGSGYDRGHLAPAADFAYDEFALSQSFFLSNISPQNSSFNRGIWRSLESQVRDWAEENAELYVITGPVLNRDFRRIGPNRVSVPEFYYKVILDIRKPEIKAIGFLMKNEASSEPLSSFVVTIDSIEQLTGLDFFPSMPDEMENKLEAAKMTSLWFE